MFNTFYIHNIVPSKHEYITATIIAEYTRDKMNFTCTGCCINILGSTTGYAPDVAGTGLVSNVYIIWRKNK